LLAFDHQFSLRNVFVYVIINLEAILAPERVVEHAGLVHIRQQMHWRTWRISAGFAHLFALVVV
jgi:hypothetical protein